MPETLHPQLTKELKAIRKELSLIREQLPDPDTVLTPEERRLVEESHEHRKKGLLLTGEELKAKLGK